MNGLLDNNITPFIDSMEITIKKTHNGRGKSAEIILSEMRKQDDEHTPNPIWGSFFGTCNKLIHLGAYDRILTFVLEMFGSRCYDLTKMEEELKKCPTPNFQKNSIEDLCKRFFFKYVEKLNDYYHLEDMYTEINNDTNPFIGETGVNTGHMQVIVRLLDVFVASEVYGFTINDKFNIATSDEYLCSIAEGFDTMKSNKINVCSRIINAGILIVRHAELDNDRELAWHVMENWVLKYMEMLPWVETNNRSLYIELSCLYYITDYLIALIRNEFKGIDEKGTNSLYTYTFDNGYLYTDSDFFRESIGDRDVYYLKWAKSFVDKHPVIGKYLSAIINKGNEILLSVKKNDEFDILIKLALLLEYASGNIEISSELLADNYYNISRVSRDSLTVQIVIVRCILEGSNYSMANRLFSYYSAEAASFDEEKNLDYYILDEMMQYIRDSIGIIKKSEITVYCSDNNTLWRDVFEKYNTFDVLYNAEKSLKEEIEKTGLPSSTAVEEAAQIVLWLAHHNGVDYKMLGCPTQAGNDYAYDLIPSWMVDRGQAIWDAYDKKIRHYYACVYRKTNYAKIEYSLKMHLFQREKNMINEQIEEMQRIINQIEGDYDDPINQKLVAQIDEYIGVLNERLLKYSSGHEKIKEKVINLYHDFMNKYFGTTGIDGDILSFLTEEESINIINFLVTSDIVFEFLSSRDYGDSLDFSPALIPLTKSLELAMNHLFKEMDAKSGDLSSTDRLTYFVQDGKKEKAIFRKRESIVLNASIDLLKRDKLFESWKGEDVLEIKDLSLFKDIPIKCYEGSKDKGSYREFDRYFGDNLNQNRKLLANGINYVRENYRNPVAHKNAINRMDYETCKKILIETENLLWIVLTILKK